MTQDDMIKIRASCKRRQSVHGILSTLVFGMAALGSLDAQTTTYGFNAGSIPGEVTVSLVEQQDNYIVRLSLPGRDLHSVNMSLDGDRLHVEAPTDGKFGRYEQDLILASAASDKNPRIDRREEEKTIVLIVPKRVTSPQQPSQSIGRNFDSPQEEPFDGMAHIMSQQMQSMERQMEQMLGGAFSDPGAFWGSGFDSLGGTALSHLNFEEQRDKYIVRANLPSPRLGKINVGIKEQVLTIEAREEDTHQNKNNNGFSSEQSEYSESMRLPGPVEIGKMKVDRKGDTLVITLPKASS